jgi:hypothetical protein
MTSGGATGSSHGEGSDGRVRAEMDDAPPFLTWRAIYVVVLGALAAEIVLALALAS